VTGLSGFIGRHCIEALHARGFEIHATTSGAVSSRPVSPVRWHTVDLLCDDETDQFVRSIQASHLLHLAWIAQPPYFWHAVENVEWLRASLRIVKSFRESGGERAVVSGSCAEYALPTQTRCFEMTSRIAPLSPYGKAKAALHLALQGYCDTAGLSLAWARLFFVYGPGEPPQKLVSSIIAELRLGRLPVVQEPRRQLDLVNVRDVGKILSALLDSPLAGPINIGTGEAHRIWDIANCVAAHLAPTLISSIDALLCSTPKGTDRDLIADINRLRTELGIREHRSLDAGISEMVRV